MSPGRDRGTAGVVTLINKNISCASTPTNTFFDEGRVLRCECRGPSGVAIYWNIHNFSIGAGALRRAVDRLRSDVATAKNDPASCVVWVGVDFNFLAGGDVPFCIATP